VAADDQAIDDTSTPTVPAVIVPFRATTPERQTNWAWVRARYADHHPDWEIILAEQSAGEWVKARALEPALAGAPDDVIVIADADLWCDGLGPAVEAVRAGAGWAIPHGTVYRLSERATRLVLDGADPHGQETQEDEDPYAATAGGGFIVSQRRTLLEIPPDPRFLGSSGMDVAWGFALRCLAGEPWRGTATAFHLWHPWDKRSDRVGGLPRSSLWLRRRYRVASHSPWLMRRLLKGIPEHA
jgi:hypothetical protein